MSAFPYSVRIMARLDGHDPIELYRSAQRLFPKVFRGWTAELSPEWTVWTERRCRDNDTITPRITVDRHHGTRGEMARDARGRLYAAHD